MMKVVECVSVILLLIFIYAEGNVWKNEGREFGFAFPPMYAWSTSSSGDCQLIATSQYSGSLYVSYQGNNLTFSVTPDFRTVIDLPTTLRPITNGYSNKAIYVTSTVDISLYAYNYYGSSGGQQSGFLLHPMINGSYTLLTRSESASGTQPHAHFTAVAKEDNTTFIVSLPKAGGGYDFSYSFILNKGDAYCSSSPTDGDFTAIRIEVNKIAFIASGHANLELYQGGTSRTQVVASVIYPNSLLGNEYLIPGIAGTDAVGGKVKVVATRPGDTTVTKNGIYPVVLKEGQATEYSFSDQTTPSYVTCTQACTAALYTYQDNTGNYGGSIQLPLISKDNFASQTFAFSTPDTDNTMKHYISIVINGANTNDIELDEVLLILDWTRVTAIYGTYSHATYEVSEGYHVIKTSHIITVYLYGHLLANSYGMSYGYPVVLQDASMYTTTSGPPIQVTGFVPGNCGNDTLCVAFSVGRESSQSENGIIYYDIVVVNDGNGFDVITSSFDAPTSGLYWLASSAGVPNATKSDQYLIGVDRLSRLYANTAINNGVDTLSRDGQFYLTEQCSNVQTVAVYPVFSDPSLQTSLCGFNLFSVTEQNSIVSFSVALSAPVTCASGTRVPFDVVQLDTVNAWDSVAYDYTIPETGSYVVSMIGVSQPNRQFAFGLYVAGISSVITVVEHGSTNQDYSLANQLIMVDLDKDQKIYAGCLTYGNSYLYSSGDHQTLIHGFLYRPKLAPLVWSVATNDDFYGYKYPVEFPLILPNRGGAWDPIQHRYEVVEGGVYYLHITGGSLPYEPLKMELMLNGAPIINIVRESREHNGILMRSRAFIWRLSPTDYLDVAGYSLIGNGQRVTTFSGFRLYA